MGKRARLAGTAIILLLLFFQLGRILPFSGLRGQDIAYDFIILGGSIVDGSGRDPYMADIGIKGEYITAIGHLKQAPAKTVVHAHGLVVAPGFINAHSHSDQTYDKHPEMLSALMQGITSEIVGNDGFSAVEVGLHLQEIAEAGLPLNYGTFLGHGSVREKIMGQESRPPSEEELRQMRTLVEKGMMEGALGLSSGLEYPPGEFAKTEELISLAEVAGEHGGIYVSHIRNERAGILEALQEVLLIGREANLPVHISHIKVGGDSVWPPDKQTQLAVTGEVIAAIRLANDAGFPVTADLYPYTVPWFLADCLLADVGKNYDFNRIQIMSTKGNPEILGKTIAEIAVVWGTTPDNVCHQLLAADPLTRVCVETILEESIRELLQEDFSMIAVDAAAITVPADFCPVNVDMTALIHPRAFGTYPRILAKYVRQEELISLEEAVHKMTGLVARTFGLSNRGLIKEGYYADLVIFNPDLITDRATYIQPALYPRGIEYVMVNGIVQVDQGQPYINKGSGRVLTLNTGW